MAVVQSTVDQLRIWADAIDTGDMAKANAASAQMGPALLQKWDAVIAVHKRHGMDTKELEESRAKIVASFAG